MHRKISEIIQERAWTKGDEDLVTDLPEKECNAVLDWIRNNISPRKTPLLTRTSYGIKHIMQYHIGIYVTNNQFKDAMLMCGFYPVDASKLNWSYCISKKSPAFNLGNNQYQWGNNPFR